MIGMKNFSKNCTSTVIPNLRYSDALKMIDWLELAFGFEKHAVYMAGETKVAHAQMTFGNGMIMLGSVDNGSMLAPLLAQPGEIGNRETQTAYLIVSDCEPIYATAKAASAEMIDDLKAKEYGGKGFTCRDPEGHIWSIGEYDPWEPQEH
jgi:uncharacterized glyoxalase superfamily protein PhnB